MLNVTFINFLCRNMSSILNFSLGKSDSLKEISVEENYTQILIQYIVLCKRHASYIGALFKWLLVSFERLLRFGSLSMNAFIVPALHNRLITVILAFSHNVRKHCFYNIIPVKIVIEPHALNNVTANKANEHEPPHITFIYDFILLIHPHLSTSLIS